MASDEDRLVQEFEAFGTDSSSENKQGIQDILGSLLNGRPDVRLSAAREIRRLTKTSNKSRSYLGAAGIIEPLVSMLKHTSSESKEAALLALLNLAVGNERNKVRITKAGAISPLVELLHSEDMDLRESAAAAVLTLSASFSNKPVIGASGATPLLVEILTTGSTQGKVDSAMALYNLSSYPDNLPSILAAGAISPLILLLKDSNKSSKVAEKTTALLDSLAAFEEGRSAIAMIGGGILALVEVLEDGSPQGREHAVCALLAMCQGSRCELRQALLQEGVIPGLLELTVQGTPQAKQDAQLLLQLLRESPQSVRSASASAALERIAYDITSHVDGEEPDTEIAKKMLTEMVQLSMEQSMRHLQQRALVCASSDLSQSDCLAELSLK